ncbi:EAL domain-containing protein [Terasakiella pusilla]|uniref:EAL domain-containing protein n=1 Tax=Terasakiella pusilla TaxID=64973 RepID=UPI003AA7BC4B
MKSSQLIALLFVGMALTIALTFHLFKSETDEINSLAQTIQLAQKVKYLDTKLNEDALKAASFKLVHFDSLVETVQSLTLARTQLNQFVTDIPDKTRPALGEQIHNLILETDYRIELIEQLKSKVALARNSSNYLLSSLRTRTNLLSTEIRDLSIRTLNDLQGYQIFPTPQRLQSAQDILARLKEIVAISSTGKAVENLLRHMDVSFAAAQDISMIQTKLLQKNSQQTIDQLITTLQTVQMSRSNTTNGYLFLLLIVAMMIFMALAYAVLKWHQASEKSHKNAQLFEDAASSMSEGFAFFGPDDKLIFWNATFERLYKALGERLKRGMSLEEFRAAQKETEHLVQREAQPDGSYLDLTKSGQWILSSNTPMSHGGRALVRVDLTEQKRTQNQLQLAATVFQTASEAMMVTNDNNIIEMVNPAFSQITGYTEEEVIGKTPQILSSGRHDEAYYRQMFEDLQTSGTWQGEIWNRRKNGEIYPEWLSITTIHDDDGGMVKRVSLFTDITSRKKSEERIHYQANYDSLTDLPNRNLFRDRLTQSLNLAKRNDQRVALFFLDIDNFKHINDTLGHIIGDELLRHVADRLRSLFRNSDTIARLSGDEFIIIINEANTDTGVKLLLDRVLECLSLPYVLDGNTTYTSVSVGATFYPDDATTVDSLLQNADAAMFKAKDLGRNTYCFFTPEMNSRAQERHDMEVALHKAMEKGHFVLHYQPIIDPQTQTVKTTESLVRWECPERGLVSPGKFIPVAEDTGLIVPMGEWILRQACFDAAQWVHEDGLDIGVSVNLSSRQFQRSDIVKIVADTLAQTGLPAEKLTLEITESLLVDDDSDVLNVLRRLRDLGVHLSIDDFGTGYSSLSYLKRFPISTLKIDRSFINDVLNDPEDAALTQAILSMAQSLGLKVVAEGVETQGQNDFLKERNCDLIQGFFYSKPLPRDQLMEKIYSQELKI